MHSSMVVAGRALVMLVCVVGIPMAALSGISWPEVLEKLENFKKDHWPAILTLESDATASQAPSWSNQPQQFTPSETTETHSTSPQPSDRPTSLAVVPAGFQSPVESAPPLAGPVHRQMPESLQLDAEPFVSIQDRLRRSGATYYLLESWGNNRQMYRFYCKVAVGGNVDFTRCFEATDADPLRAMQQVLRRVEEDNEGGKGRTEGGG